MPSSWKASDPSLSLFYNKINKIQVVPRYRLQQPLSGGKCMIHQIVQLLKTNILKVEIPRKSTELREIYNAHYTMYSKLSLKYIFFHCIVLLN